MTETRDPIPLGLFESKVIRAVQEGGAVYASDVVARLGTSESKIHVTLSRLVLKGILTVRLEPTTRKIRGGKPRRIYTVVHTFDDPDLEIAERCVRECLSLLGEPDDAARIHHVAIGLLKLLRATETASNEPSHTKETQRAR